MAGTYAAVSEVFYEVLEAVGHGLGGVWVDDEDAGCHLEKLMGFQEGSGQVYRLGRA